MKGKVELDFTSPDLWIFKVTGKSDVYYVSFLDHVIRCDCPSYHNRWNRDYGSFLCYHVWGAIFKVIELNFKDFLIKTDGK